MRSTLMAIAAAAVLACFPAIAQVDRATLAGTVTDGSGAVIPAASVQIVSQETGLRREVATNSSGASRFRNSPSASTR